MPASGHPIQQANYSLSPLKHNIIVRFLAFIIKLKPRQT